MKSWGGTGKLTFSTKKGLEIRKLLLGEMHYDTASAYNVLGKLYTALDKLDPALDNIERGLIIRNKILPPEHTDLAYSYYNRGFVLEKKGELQQALSDYQTCLRINRTNHGKNHPQVALATCAIARLYFYRGDLAKAQKLMNSYLEYQRRTIPLHLDYFRTLLLQVRILAVTAQFGQAMKVLGKIMSKIMRQKYQGEPIISALAICLSREYRQTKPVQQQVRDYYQYSRKQLPKQYLAVFDYLVTKSDAERESAANAKKLLRNVLALSDREIQLLVLRQLLKMNTITTDLKARMEKARDSLLSIYPMYGSA